MSLPISRIEADPIAAQAAALRGEGLPWSSVARRLRASGCAGSAVDVAQTLRQAFHVTATEAAIALHVGLWHGPSDVACALLDADYSLDDVTVALRRGLRLPPWETLRVLWWLPACHQPTPWGLWALLIGPMGLSVKDAEKMLADPRADASARAVREALGLTERDETASALQVARDPVLALLSLGAAEACATTGD